MAPLKPKQIVELTNMIPHHNKIVYFEFSFPHVGAKDIREKVGHAIGLQDGSAEGRFGGYEECPRIGFDCFGRRRRDGFAMLSQMVKRGWNRML